MAPIKDMIQTLVALKELRIRQEAQDLAREQFGFDQQRNTQTLVQQAQEFKLRQQGQQTSSYGQMQQTLQNQKNPAAMLPYAGQFSQMTGQPQAMIEAMMQGTPASVATTMGGATQAANADGTIDRAVAQKAMSDFNQDKVMTGIYGSAEDYMGKMKPEERQAFGQGVLQRLGTGQSVRDAVLSDQVSKFTPEQKAQAAEIAQGLRLNANDDASLGIAWAGKELRDRQYTDESAQRNFEFDIRKRQLLAANLDPAISKTALEIMDQRERAYEQYDKNRLGSTKTPLGMQQYTDQINNYNEMLRRLAPAVYGKGAPMAIVDIPKGGELSSGPSAFQAFWQRAQNMGRQP